MMGIYLGVEGIAGKIPELFVGVVSLQAAVPVQHKGHAHRVAVCEDGVHDLQRCLTN